MTVTLVGLFIAWFYILIMVLVDSDRSRKEFEVFGTADRLRLEELDPREIWWRERYDRLRARGYLLRPRYAPEWVPSWTVSNRDREECEDGKRLLVCTFFPCLSSSQPVLGIVRPGHRRDANLGR